MSIHVVTFISDPEREDRLIEMLTSDIEQVEIGFRAHTSGQLKEYLSRCPATYLLLLHDGVNVTALMPEYSGQLTEVNIAAIAGLDRTEVRTTIFAAMRRQESIEAARLSIERMRGQISVTGSSASPGITTLTLNLADELSQFTAARLIDRDQTRQDLAFLLGARIEKGSSFITENLRIESEVSRAFEGITLIDLGSSTSLERALSDRRKEVREFLTTIESSERLIYVTKPEPTLLPEIARFVECLKSKQITTPTTFVINQVGRTQRQRNAYKRINALLESFPCFTCEEDRTAVESARLNFSTLRSVAPRSRLRKTIGEIAQTALTG